MGSESIRSKVASFWLCNVSGYKTKLLDVRADDPEVHVLFIPGNPGVVMYYKEFVESLYEQMEGSIFITAVGHLSHSKENHSPQLRTSIGVLYALRRLDHSGSYLNKQVMWKKKSWSCEKDFGHSIVSYICVEMFKRLPEEVSYCNGLYPFLTLNLESKTQSLIKNISHAIVASLGLLPIRTARFMVMKSIGKGKKRKSIGKSWSKAAVEAT